jgi:ankyrin repeat protein
VKNWFPWKNRPKAPTADRGSRVLRAALAGDAAKLREAVESGDDVTAWDENGMTPLLSAVFIGDREAVRLLLSVGADPDRPSQDDPTDTPLWRARDDFGLLEIANLLVQAREPMKTGLPNKPLERPGMRPWRRKQARQRRPLSAEPLGALERR